MVVLISPGFSSDNSSSSERNTQSPVSRPRTMRLLSDIYNEAPEVDLFNDELMMVIIDGPSMYKQAVKEVEWRDEMIPGI